jgi:hypothetical protein
MDNRAPLMTDAGGRFMLTPLRANSRITLKAHKDNYRFLSAGVVTTKDGQFVASDTVLEPLTFQVSGQVVNADNQPVAGATVISPDGAVGAKAITDDGGHFTLQRLPKGEVLVLATKDGQIGQARGAGEVAVTLAPAQLPQGNDLWRAYAIVEEAWIASRDSGYDSRAVLPAVLAPYDPDLVLQLATDPYGHVPDWTLAASIAALAQYDPFKALMWAPPQLARITDEHLRFTATLALAEGLNETAPDLSARLGKEAVQKMPPMRGANDDWSRVNDLLALARYAAVVERADPQHITAHEWFDKAFAVANRADDPASLLAHIVEAMAPYFPAEAEKLALQLPAPRDKRFASGGLLERIVEALAPVDVAAAQRVLEELRRRAGKNAEMLESGPMRAIVKALAPTDAEAALALARQITPHRGRDWAIALAAAHLPAAQRAAGFQEALAGAETPYAQARIAGLAYRTDVALGRRLLASVRATIKNNVSSLDSWASSSGVAELAYYLSRDDPAAARLLLEEEYSRRRESPGENQSSVLNSIALAMAAVNVDRALEIARAIPLRKSRISEPRFETFRKIAQYVLLSKDERLDRSFGDWDATPAKNAEPGGDW